MRAPRGQLTAFLLVAVGVAAACGGTATQYAGWDDSGPIAPQSSSGSGSSSGSSSGSDISSSSGASSSGSGTFSNSNSSSSSSSSSGSSSGSGSSGSSSSDAGACGACTVDRDCQSCGGPLQPGYVMCCGSSQCYSWITSCPATGSSSSGSGGSSSSGGSSGSSSGSGGRVDAGACGGDMQPCCPRDAGVSRCQSPLTCQPDRTCG
jgi:hypothetical protein